MLRTEELESLKSDIGKYCLDTAILQRKTITPDGMGASTVKWADVDKSVKCRVTPAGDYTFNASNNLTIRDVTSWTVTVDFEVDVKPGDRLIVRNMTLDVLGVKYNLIAPATKAAMCTAL